MDIKGMVLEAIANFLASFVDELITLFSTVLVNIMGTALNVLDMPLVQNGIMYSQSLAFTILVIKGMADTINTYILHTNGDPDADPKKLIVGMGQSGAVIATLPWIVTQVFKFGTKVSVIQNWIIIIFLAITSFGFLIKSII